MTGRKQVVRRLVCWMAVLPHYTAVIVTLTLIVVLVTR